MDQGFGTGNEAIALHQQRPQHLPILLGDRLGLLIGQDDRLSVDLGQFLLHG
ncbi:hypothetical protein D3C86_1435230 [compost metagenome]